MPKVSTEIIPILHSTAHNSGIARS